jgi:UDP-N-acetylglucosamine acyltransferase
MGLNIVGLQRRKFSPSDIETISKIYHLLFVGNHSTTTAVKLINEEVGDGIYKSEILRFIDESKTGIIKRYSKNGMDEDQPY